MKKSVTKIMKATIAVAMAIGAGVGAAFSSSTASPLFAANDNISLTTVTCDANPTDDLMTWTRTQYTIEVAKASGTKVTNYYPGTSGQNYTHTRFYTGNVITVTPASGYQIDSFAITATGTSYQKFQATTNCTRTLSGNDMVFTPTVKTNQFTMTGDGTGRYTAFKVTYSVAQTTPEIQLDKASIDVGVGEDATFIVSSAHLTANFSVTGGNDSYFTTSYTPASNDGDHVVTLHGVAETASPITLTVSSTGATSRTIDVSVIIPVIYEKVVAASSLKAGKEFIIGSSDGNFVLGQYSSGNNCPALVSTPNASGNLVESNLPSGYALFTLGGESGEWTITDQSDKVYYGTSGQNYLKSANSNSDTWSISINAQGVATITSAASSYSIKKNASNALFATYSSGQSSVSIYMIPSTTPEIQVTLTAGSSSLGVGETATLSVTKLNGATGTVNWVTSNASALSLSASTGDSVTVTAGSTLGDATITASLAGCDDVVTSFKVRKGSVTQPYSVAEAVAAINGSDPLAKTDVCVSGVVSQVDSYNSTYHSITYWISNDGTTTDQFEVYGGLGLGGANFSSKDDVKVGAAVVVRGDIKKYNDTYEFEKDNVLVSYVFVNRYDITFDSKLGSAVASQRVAEGEKVQVPANPTREPDNNYTYTFNCWCTDSECTEAYDFNTSVTSSFTLYAKWNATPVPAKTVIRRDLETKSSLAYHYSKEGNAIKDTINNDLAGVSGNSYTSWSSDVEGTSGAIYAGASAASYNSIQLKNDTTNHAGIVTKTSAGNVSKIRVAWNSNTISGRTINIYGKNTAYSGTGDLYSNETKGTLIGSISCGTSTYLNIEDEYAYIGIHATQPLYLDSIEISWGSESFDYSNVSIRFSSLISASLWNRLNTESSIQGYGVMLSTPETLGSDPIEDWYSIADGETIDEKIAYLTTGGNVKNFYMPLTTKTPDQANTAQKAGAEGDHYIWYLNKVVLDNEEGLTAQQIKDKLTQRYVAVGYVRIADEIVFLDEITASAAGLAGAAITGGQANASTANGSLLNLADMLE